MARITIWKLLGRVWSALERRMKNQKASPSMQTVGPGERAVSSAAMVLLPAPTGPDNMRIEPAIRAALWTFRSLTTRRKA